MPTSNYCMVVVSNNNSRQRIQMLKTLININYHPEHPLHSENRKTRPKCLFWDKTLLSDAHGRRHLAVGQHRMDLQHSRKS